MVIEYRQDGSSMWHRSISEAARRANVSVGKLRALIYWDLPSRYGSHYDLMAGSPYHLEPYWLQKRLRFRLVPDAKETT